MNEIEKRARELLAAEYRARGELVSAFNIERGGLSCMYAAEITAIIAALTPPEGYVLVPVEPGAEWKAAVVRAAVAGTEVDPEFTRGLTEELEFWHKAMLAARPEPS